MRLRVLALLALAPLAACGSIGEAANGPKLSPMNYPAPMMQSSVQSLSAPQATPQPASANSLWRSGARAFFIDQRASRVGDILTVQIDINDSAKTINSTASSRVSGANAGVPHFFGLETALGHILPGAFSPASMIETNSKTSNSGSGAVNRSEQISLTVAAVVTGILPNGNLMIQGSQEINTNTDVRQLTVSGVVRPEDITSTNTIKHTQIAEARISYGGRGDISRVQKTPAGQALVEKFLPF